MSSAQANMLSYYHDRVAAHVNQLVTYLEGLEAKEEERVWLKRQSDGELDETRLSEGLTGESTVYKRRGLEKRKYRCVSSRSRAGIDTVSAAAELGRPQLKPKRIRIIVDVSASMYRNQGDGRLTRSLEAGTSGPSHPGCFERHPVDRRI